MTWYRDAGVVDADDQFKGLGIEKAQAFVGHHDDTGARLVRAAVQLRHATQVLDRLALRDKSGNRGGDKS